MRARQRRGDLLGLFFSRERERGGRRRVVRRRLLRVYIYKAPPQITSITHTTHASQHPVGRRQAASSRRPLVPLETFRHRLLFSLHPLRQKTRTLCSPIFSLPRPASLAPLQQYQARSSTARDAPTTAQSTRTTMRARYSFGGAARARGREKACAVGLSAAHTFSSLTIRPGGRALLFGQAH